MHTHTRYIQIFCSYSFFSLMMRTRSSLKHVLPSVMHTILRPLPPEMKEYNLVHRLFKPHSFSFLFLPAYDSTENKTKRIPECWVRRARTLFWRQLYCSNYSTPWLICFLMTVTISKLTLFLYVSDCLADRAGRVTWGVMLASTSFRVRMKTGAWIFMDFIILQVIVSWLAKVVSYENTLTPK